MGAWLAALGPAFQVFSKVLDLFVKTPEEKREEALQALLRFTQDVTNAVSIIKDTKGDTRALEDVLNRRRH